MKSAVGDYRLFEPLGKGGAGQVYLATPTVDKPFARVGEPVAVKLYNEKVLAQRNQIERIKREFSAGSKIANPYLVRIHECELSNPAEPFLVMDYVDGMPLSDWVRMFHPISEHLLMNLLSRLSSGLKALHDADIIHRDFKPENIMVSYNFVPKIMDFGVVKIKHEEGQTPSDSFLGTIRNAPPEWLRREEVEDDPRTDLYSFGTVLYCLLHGHQVFNHERQFARLVELVNKETPEIQAELRNRPEPYPKLVKLAETLLKKSPEERLPDCEALSLELKEISKTIPTGGEEPLHGYMATALTGVPEDAREAIAFKSSTIANVCKRFEVYVYQPRKASDPLLHPEVKPEAVYAMDRKRVLAADVLIVVTDQPSLGVGQELEIAASFGVPTILIRRANSKLSRMVTGSFLNLIDEIIYDGPEDLEDKLRRSVSRNITRIRSFKRSPRPAIPENFGAELRSMRQSASLSLEEAAMQVGCSPRLIQALEEKSPRYHNVGLHLFGRILTVYGKTVGQVFAGDASPSANQPGFDQNVRRLEQVAKSEGWPFADYLELRSQYERVLAASGDSKSVTLEMWQQRHTALLARRLKDDQASTPEKRQDELF